MFKAKLNLLEIITPADIIVFILVLLLTVAAVIYGNTRLKKNGDKLLDYMLIVVLRVVEL